MDDAEWCTVGASRRPGSDGGGGGARGGGGGGGGKKQGRQRLQKKQQSLKAKGECERQNHHQRRQNQDQEQRQGTQARSGQRPGQGQQHPRRRQQQQRAPAVDVKTKRPANKKLARGASASSARAAEQGPWRRKGDAAQPTKPVATPTARDQGKGEPAGQLRVKDEPPRRRWETKRASAPRTSDSGVPADTRTNAQQRKQHHHRQPDKKGMDKGKQHSKHKHGRAAQAQLRDPLPQEQQSQAAVQQQQQEQTKGRRTNARAKTNDIDISKMMRMLIHRAQSKKNKGKRVTLTVGHISSGVTSQRTRHKSKASRQKAGAPTAGPHRGRPHNPLDSSPAQKRGVVKTKRKRKRPTRIRRALLLHRALKKKQRKEEGEEGEGAEGGQEREEEEEEEEAGEQDEEEQEKREERQKEARHEKVRREPQTEAPGSTSEGRCSQEGGGAIHGEDAQAEGGVQGEEKRVPSAQQSEYQEQQPEKQHILTKWEKTKRGQGSSSRYQKQKQQQQQQARPKQKDEQNQHDVPPADVSAFWSFVPGVHSNRFREYCTHVLSKDLNKAVTTAFKKSLKFQQRHKNNPAAKRRVCVGFREVQRKAEQGKPTLIVMAPDIKRHPGSDGLDAAVHAVLTTAAEHEIPVVFALGKRHLAYALKRKGDVSVAAILFADGVWDEIKHICNTLQPALTQQLQQQLATARQGDSQDATASRSGDEGDSHSGSSAKEAATASVAARAAATTTATTTTTTNAAATQ